MANIETLSVVINVQESFEDELGDLLAALEVIDQQIDRVDGSVIDLNTAPAHAKLTGLQAQLASINENLSGGMDVDMNRRMGDMSTGRSGTGLNLPSVVFDDIDDILGDGGDSSVAKTADAMADAADSATDAGDSMDLFNFRMQDMHNAMAKMVPVLLVFIGAIPAVVANIVALGAAAISAASALAAIAGFGLVGAALARGDGDIGEGFREIINEISQSLQDELLPLARQLAPMGEDLVDGLGTLFNRIAQEGDALTQLTDDARAFGRFMLDFIPSALEGMGELAEAAGPLFGMIADFFAETDFSRAFANILADTLPAMAGFVQTLREALPAIIKISTGFLMVASAVLQFLGLVWRVVTLFGVLNEEAIGVAIASFLTLATVIAIVNSAFITMAAAAIESAITSLIAFTGEVIAAASAQSLLAAASLTAAGAIRVLKYALISTGIGALLVVVGTAISQILQLGGAFGGASSKIDEATRSLRNFERQASKMDNAYGLDDPTVDRGQFSGVRGSQGGASINVTVEGDADEDTVRTQLQNAMYRTYRPGA